MKVQAHQLPVVRACQIVQLSRAAYYRQPPDPLQRDGEVMTALNQLVARHARWGFWKCFDRLRLNGHRWNHKRVHRVYCAISGRPTSCTMPCMAGVPFVPSMSLTKVIEKPCVSRLAHQ